ncbi:hypothetical protein FACS1894168_3380 [Deltaproteobacteria bacterium]|nr:hypothetical protein FACS1894168_3380 [Deltaproteobacteria bacterium]
MKVIGKSGHDSYICDVSHREIEKFLNLYYGKMEKFEVGEEIDLGKGYNFLVEIRDAMDKTSEFIQANKKIISAITDGIMLCGISGKNNDA